MNALYPFFGKLVDICKPEMAILRFGTKIEYLNFKKILCYFSSEFCLWV